MKEIIFEVLTCYVVSCVITSSSILHRFRNWFTNKTPWLKISGHAHFIECRLCVSFWISILSVFIYSGNIYEILPCYGAAYWLCTQER